MLSVVVGIFALPMRSMISLGILFNTEICETPEIHQNHPRAFEFVFNAFVECCMLLNKC